MMFFHKLRKYRSPNQTLEVKDKNINKCNQFKILKQNRAMLPNYKEVKTRF